MSSFGRECSTLLENKLVPVPYVFMEVYMSNELNVLLKCMGPDSDPQWFKFWVIQKIFMSYTSITDYNLVLIP